MIICAPFEKSASRSSGKSGSNCLITTLSVSCDIPKGTLLISRLPSALSLNNLNSAILPVRPFFKSLFVYRVFLRFESQLSTKGNRQIPERISRWQRCSAVIGPDQLPSRVLPLRNSLSAINERTFGKRSSFAHWENECLEQGR